ncbi:universal stress protein [Chloroflexota bacterium]
MYERIFVPLDGSEVGEAALPYVEDLVSKLKPEVNVEVILFQVIPKMIHHVMGGEGTADIPYTEEVIRENKEKVMNYLNRVGETLRNKGATVTVKVALGGIAAEEIIKAADEVKANLIAISTHGRSGLSRWVFGSVTEKVLRHEETVPVVVVRARKHTSKA